MRWAIKHHAVERATIGGPASWSPIGRVQRTLDRSAERERLRWLSGARRRHDRGRRETRSSTSTRSVTSFQLDEVLQLDEVVLHVDEVVLHVDDECWHGRRPREK